MNSMIYNPLEDYDKKFRDLHFDKTTEFFNALVARSGVDIEANRKTVAEYDAVGKRLRKIRRKRTLWLVLRVLMCITLVLIPLVIFKITPMLRELKNKIGEVEREQAALLAEAHRQMAPLNALFTDRDALKIIEEIIPQLDFAPCFSAEQESDMVTNYDFHVQDSNEQSTLDVLAGRYNENPFLFETRLIHKMGVETYHGYKTICWTERYRDSDGRTRTRTRTQTLHATVVKPKPFYHTQVLLNYCAQGAPDLSFTRDATHLEQKSEKEIEKYVKKGEKKLKKKTDKALRENDDFVSMSNTDFEVLFDALDRTDEVQFRTLFTPLAQTNMVDLIRSTVGYGDDFHFIKEKRTNRIVAQHSQGREINLTPSAYTSYAFDVIQNNFITKNTAFFKAVYFDFAPIWAIPVYQERPVHSLDPIPDYAQKYACKECEALAHAVSREHVVHPATKTQAILKASFVGTQNALDEVSVEAFSYDIAKRLDVVPMLGGDGRIHGVPVPWDDYLPLTATNRFFVGTEDAVGKGSVLARRSNLCIIH
ncbi:MAG: hypothetical protein IKJ35_01120 [Clostridia bacterium]|nr:hypothetical protein [Clostridia bacterium]